jgi:uncharacterized protein YjbI with pentapeptide repeats
LEGAILFGANLANTNLAFANLRGADLSDARLGKTSLIGADLSNARLANAKADGANFSGANLTNVDTKTFDLARSIVAARPPLLGRDKLPAPLKAAFESHAHWLASIGRNGTQAYLEGADLSYFDLSGMDLSGAVLRNAKFVGANLAGAVLLLANLRGADFFHADLSGAKLHGAMFDGAKLRETELAGAKALPMPIANPDGSSSTRTQPTSFVRADLTGAKTKGFDMSQANLEGAALP